MEVKKYKNLKEAIKEITKESRDYVFVRHTLNLGDEIKLHYHNKANEFIIIENGKFKVRLEDEKKIFNLKNQVIAIHFPKEQKHTILALTSISYFVFRDTEDASIFVKTKK
jgi:quercetin dioxygenase-like cupin family protein